VEEAEKSGVTGSLRTKEVLGEGVVKVWFYLSGLIGNKSN